MNMKVDTFTAYPWKSKPPLEALKQKQISSPLIEVYIINLFFLF